MYEASNLIDIDSASAAVTWSDTLAVFTVESERALPAPSGEEKVLAGRRVTVRVDDVVWKRAGAEQPPASFEAQADGWVYGDDDQMIPMRAEDDVRLEVGKTYLAPIIRIYAWGFGGNYLEVVDGVVSAAPYQDSPLAVQLDGKTVEEAAKVIAAARAEQGAGPLAATTAEQLEATGVDIGG
ncbi:hypothetical protein GHK92_19175 [Nocardioides sp. dk4132]|uniref:hypothetical protein n=1 Tax=unclassified Nocardioides TaxID=2615069 RepID=UPI001297AE92|nr:MULTISPECIES: hypothetical protein [unclassified Nocardioides]MQW77994.1 hypothetical protein [Nocardioides sp. dk4132]QGA08102.1 hypothetical protein GFH29_12355 [Nocardioides sp. dk884]